MNIDTNAILALPIADKLRLVELLWDDLGSAEASIPLPAWVEEEANRRREQMQSDSKLGYSHDETWARLASLDG